MVAIMHAEDKGQRLLGSKVRLETNGRTNRRTEPITSPFPLTRGRLQNVCSLSNVSNSCWSLDVYYVDCDNTAFSWAKRLVDKYENIAMYVVLSPTSIAYISIIVLPRQLLNIILALYRIESEKNMSIEKNCPKIGLLIVIHVDFRTAISTRLCLYRYGNIVITKVTQCMQGVTGFWLMDAIVAIQAR